MPSSSILAPYPADFRPPSISTGFAKYGNPGSAGPIFTGSTNTGLGTPLPGAVLSINEFGLDQIERVWMVKTASAAGLKPEPRDPDPYLGGMYCTTSSSTDGEGLMSTIRATYKGLVKNQIRPAERIRSCDTEQQSISFLNVAEIQGVSVPQPVYTLRGASTTEPDGTQEGQYFQSPPRVPSFVNPFETLVVLPGGTSFKLVFVPHPYGWLCDKVEWREAALHYEVAVQYRLKYIFKSQAPA